MSMANVRIDPVSRFRVLRQLGQTQLTRIYLVAQRDAGPKLGLFSLELLRPDLARDADLRSSFLDQAARAKDLEHPNLVRTREILAEAVLPDVAIAQSGAYGKTTEWLDGQPFSRLLERVGRADFPLPLYVRILCRVLAGLEFAHQLGEQRGGGGALVHRDISPENVLITYDGQVRLIGTGFARTLEALERRIGHLLTDFGYAAPELCLGYPATPSGDIYAVGVMLWEGLARVRRTFASSVADCLRLRTNGEEPGIEELYPDVPERLAQICRRALAVSPRDRYPDAAEMRVDLESYLADTQPESEQRDEQEAALAPLAELMDHHFAPERSEMLLFIGSQWSDSGDGAATRVALAAAPSDEDADDTLENELTGLPEPFLASGWDEHTHTVTGFEVLDASAVPSSVRSSTNLSAAEAPQPPAHTSGIKSQGLYGAAAAQSAEAPPECRPLDMSDQGPAELLENPGLRAHPELIESPPEEPPSTVPRRFVALTEPLDPALMEAAVRRRRAARGARSPELGWSYWERLQVWTRTVNPFSIGALGIALALVSLALVTRGARTTRHAASVSKAIAPVAPAPLAVTAREARSPSRLDSVTKSSAPPLVGESAAPGSSAPGQLAHESLDHAAQGRTSSASLASEQRLAAALASPPNSDSAAGLRTLASEPARAAPSSASNPGSSGASGSLDADGAASSSLPSVDSDADAVYLRSEDVERLREVGDLSSGASRSYASRPPRATRPKAKEDPSPAPLHIQSPEPRLIDETDPYTP